MTITISTAQNDTVIRVGGNLDAAAAVTARDAFQRVIDGGGEAVVVDMSETDFIDSSGVGALVFLYKRLVVQNRKMSLSGLTGQPRDLIGLLRLDRTIPTTSASNAPAAA